MILVDIKLVSEIMKIAPSRTLIKWLNDQKSSSLYVSTVTIAEVEYGLRILPSDKRRLLLKEKFEAAGRSSPVQYPAQGDVPPTILPSVQTGSTAPKLTGCISPR